MHSDTILVAMYIRNEDNSNNGIVYLCDCVDFVYYKNIYQYWVEYNRFI